MRVMVRTALKKVKEAGGLDGVPASENDTPTKAKKAGGKRKSTDDEAAETPSKKGRGRPKKPKAEEIAKGM